jgi:hypothetical protein
MFAEGLVAFNIDGDTQILETYWHASGMSEKQIKALRGALLTRSTSGRQRGIRNPYMFAAYMAETEMMIWRARNQKRRCPSATRDKIVQTIAEAAKHWHINQMKQPLDAERILTILRGPKSRRL